MMMTVKSIKMYLLMITQLLSAVSSVFGDCGLVDLDIPGLPVIGSIEYLNKSTAEGSFARLFCARGYKRKGSAIARCAPSDVWTVSETPTCQENECHNPTYFEVGHGKINTLPDEKTTRLTYGSAYTVICNDGYTLGDDEPSRICYDSGVWSGEPPKCVPVPQPSINNMSNPQPVSGDCGLSYVYYILPFMAVGVIHYVITFIGNVMLICYIRRNKSKTIGINYEAFKDDRIAGGCILGLVIALFHFVLPISLLSICDTALLKPARYFLGIGYVDLPEEMSCIKRRDQQNGIEDQSDPENQQGGEPSALRKLQIDIDRVRQEKDAIIAERDRIISEKSGTIRQLEAQISRHENEFREATLPNKCTKEACVINKRDLEHANNKITDLEQNNNELHFKLDKCEKICNETKIDLAVAKNTNQHLAEHVQNIQRVGEKIGVKAFEEKPNPEDKDKVVRFVSSIGDAEQLRNLMKESQQADWRAGPSSDLESASNYDFSANNSTFEDDGASNITQLTNVSTLEGIDNTSVLSEGQNDNNSVLSQGQNDNSSLLAQFTQGHNMAGTEETSVDTDSDYMKRLFASLPARIKPKKKE